jgi:hypothetical protein
MNKLLLSSIILWIGVSIGSALSRSYGWYGTYWYTDIILHTISGIALGLLWMSINKKHAHMSTALYIVSVVSFAVFGSFIWELWEWSGLHFTPSHSQFYKPELADTLGDIACGGTGGMVSAFIVSTGTRS